MRAPLAVVALLGIGALLMANPLYLPVAVEEPDPVYTHTVRPVAENASLPTADGDANGPGGAVDYADLDPAVRAAFDRARESSENGFGVENPAERVDALSYPTDPDAGEGVIVVEYDRERYAFWTRTVEREPGAVVAQRVLLQPVAFLAGFLSVVAAVAVGFRGGLDGREA
ncbi:hypothetical protein GJ633_06550 [Halorubrum sp. CBA1125]|uniref:hypothetical protein n=1 Tax=Halorubrum sp. CBA1125 TaxID=2668072 RepID=UPI0012E72207|nr:hypothetical protein [Halorubrum sp. CBA1125]MUW14359.1 hypothetical protein [Halorubrum sp. CBA1125]